MALAHDLITAGDCDVEEAGRAFWRAARRAGDAGLSEADARAGPVADSGGERFGRLSADCAVILEDGGGDADTLLELVVVCSRAASVCGGRAGNFRQKVAKEAAGRGFGGGESEAARFQRGDGVIRQRCQIDAILSTPACA